MIWMPDPFTELNDDLLTTANRLHVTAQELVTRYVEEGIERDKPIELLPVEVDSP